MKTRTPVTSLFVLAALISIMPANSAHAQGEGDVEAKFVAMLKNATLKVYKGAPHGMCTTHKDQVNADLLAFIKS